VYRICSHSETNAPFVESVEVLSVPGRLKEAGLSRRACLQVGMLGVGMN